MRDVTGGGGKVSTPAQYNTQCIFKVPRMGIRQVIRSWYNSWLHTTRFYEYHTVVTKAASSRSWVFLKPSGNAGIRGREEEEVGGITVRMLGWIARESSLSEQASKVP